MVKRIVFGVRGLRKGEKGVRGWRCDNTYLVRLAKEVKAKIGELIDALKVSRW